MPRDNSQRRLDSWAAALTYALELLDKADPAHFLSRVSFGTYADRVGGGHYADLTFLYSVGSNVEAHRQTKEQRIRMIVNSYETTTAVAREEATAGQS